MFHHLNLSLPFQMGAPGCITFITGSSGSILFLLRRTSSCIPFFLMMRTVSLDKITPCAMRHLS
jgi:hypothetical protein